VKTDKKRGFRAGIIFMEILMKDLLTILLLSFYFSTTLLANENVYFNYTEVKVIAEDGEEVPAGPDIIEALEGAEAEVTGDIKKKCFEKEYVENNPEFMKNFMREFFKKGAGCESFVIE